MNNTASGIIAGSLAALNGIVGYGGAPGQFPGNSAGLGTFTQSGGMANLGNVAQSTFAAGGLYLGYNAADAGTYNLNSLGVLSAYFEYVGNSGTGTLLQSGGTNNIQTDSIYNGGILYVGNNVASSGAYNLSGSGVLTVAGTEVIGNLGTGTFLQSGGSNAIGNGFSGAVLVLGNNAGASGSYLLSGSGGLSASSEFVGSSGSGAFSQSGGTNSIGGNGSGGLYLGNNLGSSGSYTLSGGSLSVSGNGEFVGQSGNGTFTQPGGTNNNATAVYLGYNPGSSGSYTLSGSGLLLAPSLTVGNSGSGTFFQNGGSNQVGGNGTGELYVGYNAGTSGSYTLSGSGQLWRYAGRGLQRQRHILPIRRHEQRHFRLSRLRHKFQRQLHPQRLGAASVVYVDRGQQRQRHVYPVRRHEQRQ